jgi:MoaA/NifB/PqqE/SkfB family radical SAM enzyme
MNTNEIIDNFKNSKIKITLTFTLTKKNIVVKNMISFFIYFFFALMFFLYFLRKIKRRKKREMEIHFDNRFDDDRILLMEINYLFDKFLHNCNTTKELLDRKTILKSQIESKVLFQLQLQYEREREQEQEQEQSKKAMKER